MNIATWNDMIGKWYNYRPHDNFSYVCYIVDAHDPIVAAIQLSKDIDRYADSANMGNIYDYEPVKPSEKGLQRAVKAVFR